MPAIMLELAPLILGSALAPIWIIIVLLMLASPRGLLKALAFVVGMSLTRVLQGVVFGLVFGASSEAEAVDGGKSTVSATLLLVVGILLLISAYRKWRKEEDPDDPPPKWMQAIDQLTPLKALGMGAGLVAVGIKLWVFTLSAISEISAIDLSRNEAITAYLLFILLAQSLLILPILIYAIVPKAAAKMLETAIAWLLRYNRPITITVTLIFGSYFTWDGLTSLLS